MLCPRCPERPEQYPTWKIISWREHYKEHPQQMRRGFGGTKWCVRCGYVTLEDEDEGT